MGESGVMVGTGIASRLRVVVAADVRFSVIPACRRALGLIELSGVLFALLVGVVGDLAGAGLLLVCGSSS